MKSNPFWLMAGLFATVGSVFAALKGLGVIQGMPGPSNLNWIRVHVITIGTILQMIFASLPGILARKFSISDRSVGESWLQWVLLNAGFILIIVGLIGVDSWTASGGATLIFIAVWRLWAGASAGWRKSGHPMRESMRFYLTAPFYLLTGITMAVGLLFNWWAPGGRVGTLEAHVHANVWGFLALIVAGMLFDLFPALVGGPMAHPQWIGAIYSIINIGVLGLIVGPWLNIHDITLTGLGIYFAGTGLLITNLVLTLVKHRKAPPAAVHMVLAYIWMVVPAFFAPFIVLAPQLIHADAVEAAATQGLVNGWILGMLMGGLPRLLRTRGGLTGTTLFAADHNGKADGCWPSVVALNVGVTMIWATGLVVIDPARQILYIGGYALVVFAWIPFLRRIWPLITHQVA